MDGVTFLEKYVYDASGMSEREAVISWNARGFTYRCCSAVAASSHRWRITSSTSKISCGKEGSGRALIAFHNLSSSSSLVSS